VPNKTIFRFIAFRIPLDRLVNFFMTAAGEIFQKTMHPTHEDMARKRIV